MSKNPREEQQDNAAGFMLFGWVMAMVAIAWWSFPLGLFVAGVSIFVHGLIQYRGV